MMHSPRAIVLASLLIVATTVAICAGDTSPAAPDSEPPTIASPQPEAAPVLPDASHFVLVRGAEEGSLIVDPAEFLSGNEARDAAVADGFLAPGEDLPNDFYLRNAEAERLSVAVADSATFTLVGFDASGGLLPREVDAATLLALLAGADASEYYGFVASELPLHIEVREGVVQSGSQQYVP